MKKIETLPLEAVEPGMRTALPVADKSGRLLLPPGTELSESILASLRRREIEAVSIEVTVEDPAAVEQHRQQVQAQLDRLFRLAGEAPETMTLRQAVVRYRMEHHS